MALQVPACLGADLPPLTRKAHREPLTADYKSQHSRLRPSLLFPPQTGSASILSPHGRIEFKKNPQMPPRPPQTPIVRHGSAAGGPGGRASRHAAAAGTGDPGGGRGPSKPRPCAAEPVGKRAGLRRRQGDGRE